MLLRSKCLLLCKSILLFPLFHMQNDRIQNLFYVIIQPTVEGVCKERICDCMVLYAPFPLICFAK